MAGGFGTRLRPVTCTIPKPMVPVVNKPLMEHIVERLREAGIKDILSILYFQADKIIDYFGDGSKFGVNMEYVTALADYGTAGSVKAAESFLNERFVIISGDVLTDFKIWEAINFHEKKGSLATIMLTRVENPLSFGIVITDENGKIVRFLEKPSWGQVFSDTINTGIYILEPDALDLIPPETEFDFSKNLFPKILEKKLPLYGYIAKGYWKDVGDLNEYRNVNMDVLFGKVKVNISEEKKNTIGYDLWVGENSVIDEETDISGGVLIGRNCQIKKGVVLKDCVIGDDSIVDEGATIKNSVFWNSCKIESGANVKKALIGKNVSIKKHAFVEEEAIISDDCIVGEGATIRAGIKMWPSKTVEDGAVLSSSLIWGEKWNRALFGAEGISGIANVEITPEFAAKVGASLGAMIGKGSVVATSRDSHKVSRMVNRALISGLLSVGVNVNDLRVTPECVARYQVSEGSRTAGIHTRKSPFSHNSVDIKFIDSNGMDMPNGKQKSIERLFFREDFPRANIEDTGRLTFPYRVIEYYQDALLNFIDVDTIKNAQFKFTLDYSYGPATNVFPNILSDFGCEVISLNTYLDEKKLTKSYEEFRNEFIQLSDISRSLKANLGIMFDVGAEKIYIVDDQGNMLPDDVSQSLMALLLLATSKKKSPKIAVPVSSSSNIEKIAAKFGGNVIRTKASPRGIMETALNKDIDLACDGMGGFIFPEFNRFFDSMVASAKLIEMLAKMKKNISSLCFEIPPSNVVFTQVPCPFELKGTIMRKLVENNNENEMELIDGVRIKRDGEWVLLLPDPDRSYFLIYAEADSKNRSHELLAEYKKRVTEWVEKA